MAIGKISGGMLNSNLVRYGIDLAFETDLAYLDVTNKQFGIGTNAPDSRLQVVGVSHLDDLTIYQNRIITTAADQEIYITPNGTGNVIMPRAMVTTIGDGQVVYAGPSGYLQGDSGVTLDPATGFALSIPLLPGTLELSGNTITNQDPNGNINITSPGTGIITVSNLVVEDLTTGQVPYISGAGRLAGTDNMAYDSINQELSITGSLVVDDTTINGTTISSANTPLVLTSPATESTVISGSKSVHIPTGPTTDRPTTPVAGMIRFNVTSSQLEFYNGTEWASAGQEFTTITGDTFAGDDVTTQFTLSQPASNAESLVVAINGVVQQPGVAYGVSGTLLTFSAPPANGDVIDVRNITSSYSFDTLSDATGSTTIEVEQSTNDNTIRFTTSSVERVVINDVGVLDASQAHSLGLPVHTKAEVNALTNVFDGQIVYVSDGYWDAVDAEYYPCLAVYDGTNWRIITFGSIL